MKLFRLFSFLSLIVGFASLTYAQVHVGPGQMYKDLGDAAHAKSIHAGDTVYLHAGTYSGSTYFIDSLMGTPDRWITIRPWQNDSVSIHEQYQVLDAQYVHFTHLNFYGDDPAQSARVYHLLQFDYEYHCYSAIHDILIDSCRFTDLNNAGKQGSGAFLKFTGTDRFEVRNCVFRNGTNVADGISMNGDANGVIHHCTFENISGNGSHVKGGTKSILYEKNTFIDCIAAGIDVGGDTGPQFFCPLGAAWEADSIRIYSNIFIGGTTGIRMSSCHNSNIYNNTCFKSTQFAFRSLNASSNNVYLFNNHIVNNIFTTYSTNRIYVNASAGADLTTEFVENNLFHDYKQPDPAAINFSEISGAHISGTIIGDPLFTDTAKHDFTLREGSPAISAGAQLTEPVTDFRVVPYSKNSRSIGANEFAEKPIERAMAEHEVGRNITIAPSPAHDWLNVEWLGNAAELSVTDMLGREIIHPEPLSSKVRLDIRELAPGEYFLTVHEATGAVLGMRRFVVQ